LGLEVKSLSLLFLLFCSPAWPAQHIQRASIEFIMNSPEALDVLLHAEIWVFKSSTDDQFYTSIRALVDETAGGTTRECILWKRGTIPAPATIQVFHHYTLFFTNSDGLDTVMKDWCIK